MPSGMASRALGEGFVARPSKIAFRILCGAVLVVALPALSVLAYLSQFTRYLADDFCYAAQLNLKGFIGSQVYWYTEWSGRFVSNFLDTFLVWLGAWLTPLLPAVLLFGWLVTLSWLFSEIIQLRLQTKSRGAGLVLGALCLFTLFRTLPNLAQALYWQISLVSYAAPLILGCACAALIAFQVRTNRLAKKIALASVALLSFLAGGMAEMFAVFQTSVFALLLILVLTRYHTQKNFIFLILAGCVGAAIALLIQLFAPGNQVRATGLYAARDVVTLSAQTIEYSSLALTRLFNSAWLELAFAFGAAILCGWLLAWHTPRQLEPRAQKFSNALLWLIPLAMLGLFALSIFPVVYALGAFPPPRALTLPHFILAVGIVLWGLEIGHTFGKRISFTPRAAYLVLTATTLYSLLFIYWGIGNTHIFLQAIPVAQTFARAWDERDAALKQARRDQLRRVAVARVDNAAWVDDLSTAPRFWVNFCMARAYRLRAITRE